MTTRTGAPGEIPKPWWFDKHHSEWPPEARTAYGILATIALRRLRRMQEEQRGAAQPLTEEPAPRRHEQSP